MTSFKDRLNEALIMRGIKPAELARLSGVNEGAISQYRKGAYKANQYNLEKIANALNVPIPWLMGNDVPSPFDGISLNYRDERQIAADLEKMLADLDSQNTMAAMGGTVEDDEDRELLRASLQATMRLAKKIAKEKYTPKKYRQNKE